MNKILIEVIITNNCNKRCEYCDLDFRDNVISDNNIKLLTGFLNNDNINYFHINFFGGEPLLYFTKIKRIIKEIKINKIKYSIGTNGNLLNNTILNFFYDNNVYISLSIDNITGLKNIGYIDKKYFNIIEINFINDPDFLFNSEKIFLEIINRGFLNINFMPVFTTKKWKYNNLVKLGKVIKNIKHFISNIKCNINYFSYFNGISSDKQFILDTDGFFYNDLDSLLWIQKQYSIINIILRRKINLMTKNISLNSCNFSFKKLLDNYNIKDILKLVKEIPQKQGYEKDYILLKKVIDNEK